MSNVKGSAVLSRLQYVEDKHGAACRARLIESLPDRSHGSMRGGHLLPHQWVPYSLFIDVNVTADRLFGKGDLALCETMARYGAEQNLPTLYRIFYRLGTPLFIFKKAARLWEVHYDSGRLIPAQEAENVIRLRVVDFAEPHRAHCLSVLGWATRSAELSGAKSVRGVEDRCRLRGDGECDFVLTWE